MFKRMFPVPIAVAPNVLIRSRSNLIQLNIIALALVKVVTAPWNAPTSKKVSSFTVIAVAAVPNLTVPSPPVAVIITFLRSFVGAITPAAD